MENKREILESLLHVLQKTRAGSNLQGIELSQDEEMVTLKFTTSKKLVNVACDSGIAMIFDIAKALAY